MPRPSRGWAATQAHGPDSLAWFAFTSVRTLQFFFVGNPCIAIGYIPLHVVDTRGSRRRMRQSYTHIGLLCILAQASIPKRGAALGLLEFYPGCIYAAAFGDHLGGACAGGYIPSGGGPACCAG